MTLEDPITQCEGHWNESYNLSLEEEGLTVLRCSDPRCREWWIYDTPRGGRQHSHKYPGNYSRQDAVRAFHTELDIIKTWAPWED